MPERQAPPNEVLPQPRLRLVDAGRGAVPNCRAVEVAPDALEVHSVSCLVDRAEQALVEEVAIHACGDAHVPRAEGDAERMCGDVLPSALEVIAERGDSVKRVPDLLVRIESAMEHAVVDCIGMAFDVRDERDDCRLELSENCLQLIGRQSGLGSVEQRVVRTLLIAQRLGHALVELDVLLEIRGEDREVGLAAGPLAEKARRPHDGGPRPPPGSSSNPATCQAFTITPTRILSGMATRPR